MKEIKAYVHRHCVAGVLHAVKDHFADRREEGCRNLCVYSIHGLLRPTDHSERHYSMDLAEAVTEEAKIELLCEEAEVGQIVSLIERHARTGDCEAGWVVVSDVNVAFPIGRRIQDRDEPRC